MRDLLKEERDLIENIAAYNRIHQQLQSPDLFQKVSASLKERRIHDYFNKKLLRDFWTGKCRT